MVNARPVRSLPELLDRATLGKRRTHRDPGSTGRGVVAQSPAEAAQTQTASINRGRSGIETSGACQQGQDSESDERTFRPCDPLGIHRPDPICGPNKGAGVRQSSKRAAFRTSWKSRSSRPFREPPTARTGPSIPRHGDRVASRGSWPASNGETSILEPADRCRQSVVDQVGRTVQDGGIEEAGARRRVHGAGSPRVVSHNALCASPRTGSSLQHEQSGRKKTRPESPRAGIPSCVITSSRRSKRIGINKRVSWHTFRHTFPRCSKPMERM